MSIKYSILTILIQGILLNATHAQSSGVNRDALNFEGLAKSNVYLFVGRCWEIPISIPFKSTLYIYNTNKCSHDSSLAYYNVVYQGGLYIVDTSDVYNSKELYGNLTRLSESQKDSLYLTAFSNDSLRTATLKQQWVQRTSGEVNVAKMQGIIITECGLFDVSEYTEGTGYSFEVFNPENRKTIKYITLKVVAYNPVKDKVYSAKYSGYTVTLRGVGPIKPGEAGSYSWDYVWLTDLPQTSKILSITVQYMDGSAKVITDPTKVILSEAAKSALNLDYK